MHTLDDDLQMADAKLGFKNMVRVSKTVRNRAIGILQADQVKTHIAELMNCTQRTCHNTWRKCQQYG